MWINSIECSSVPSGMKTIFIKEGTEIIPEAFFKDSDIEYVYIPDSVKIIESHAFEGCKKLESIILPKNLEKIGNYVFAKSGIRQIMFPDNIKSVPAYCFAFCTFLQKINLNNVEKIEHSAFNRCMMLQNIDLKNVKEIANSSFYRCYNLRNINFGKVISIGKNSFDGCQKIETLDIPRTVKSIDNCAFKNCEKIRFVTLPDTLDFVGKQVFENNKIERLIYKGRTCFETLAEYRVEYNPYTLQELMDMGYTLKEANVILKAS